MDARLAHDIMRTQPVMARPEVNSDALVTQHLPLVRRIARLIFMRTSSALSVEDLVQIGVIALLEASAVFEDRGVALFTTYASTRIRGAMIDELRRSATVSRQALRNRREFSATRDRLASVLGQQPSDTEMAEKLDMSLPSYRAAVSATQSLRYESMDAAYTDHSLSFADHSPDALDMLEQSKLKGAVASAIAELPERESMILQLYFIEELSLDEIGQTLDVSAARVCQIKKVALTKIRRRLGGWA